MSVYAGVRIVTTFDEQPQGATMDRERLDTVEVQVVSPEQPIQRSYREIAQMLVINGIEFDVLDEVLQVGNFDHGNTVVLQDRADPGDETVRVCDVGEHVVCMHDVGLLSARRKLASELLGKEVDQRRDARFHGHPGRSIGGIDPEYRDLQLDIVSQQVAVIARELDYKAVL